MKYETDAEYFTQPSDKLRIGSSMLRMYRENPFLFYRTWISMEAPQPESTPAFQMGHAVEALVFGWPERVICSEFETARGKAHQELVAANPGKCVMPIPDYELAHAIAGEVLRDSTAQIVLSCGQAQMAGRIDMGEFYLQCKHDWLIEKPTPEQSVLFGTGGAVVVDFKTTAAMRTGYSCFLRQVTNFGYIEQAALYQIIHHQITGEVPAWFWLVAEKEWPREVALFKADDDTMYEARARVKEDVKRLQNSFEEESWYNSSELVEVIYA
jgi:hypothetical protein